MAIDVFKGDLENIIEGGIKNFHQTGSTGAVADADLRNEVEAYLLGMPTSEYAQLPDSYKAHYGMAKVGNKYEKSTHQKPFIYVLNTEKIRNRVTFTIADSLLSFQKRKQSEAQGLRLKCWLNRGISPNQIEALGSSIYLKEEFVGGHTFGFGTRIDEDVERGVARAGGATYAIEAQVWGPIHPEDISALIFESYGYITNEIIEAHQRIGIKTYLRMGYDRHLDARKVMQFMSGLQSQGISAQEAWRRFLRQEAIPSENPFKQY